MDLIMQYTGGLTTAAATFVFALTFLIGIWAAAKFGKATLLVSLILVPLTFYVRFKVSPVPLGLVAIASMSVLHAAAGALLGLLLKRSKRFGPSAG